MLTLEELRDLVDPAAVDTVVLAFTDMQGRLQGKRFAARFFLDEVARARHRGLQLPARRRRRHEHRRRLRDVLLGPRLRRLRACAPTCPPCAGSPGTRAPPCSLADLAWEDGTPGRRLAPADPAPPARPARRARLAAHVGTELEFIVFRDTYEQAWDEGYRGLTPANQYNVDYSILGTGRIEPLLRRIRNEMAGAGLVVESAKGECNLGQHEIAFRYDEALATCDQHADLQDRGQGDRRAGGHVRSPSWPSTTSARATPATSTSRFATPTDGTPVMAGDGPERHVRRSCATSSPVSSPRCASFTLLYAPNINSYKRFVPGSFAPTAVAWGHRQPHLRAAGGRPRPLGCAWRTGVPGGDVNPYLAVAGAGRRRAARRRARAASWSRPCAGNAYAADVAAGARPPCARPPTSGRTARSPGRRSATRLSPTTATWPASSWRRSTPRSPTGSCAAASNACDPGRGSLARHGRPRPRGRTPAGTRERRAST